VVIGMAVAGIRNGFLALTDGDGGEEQNENGKSANHGWLIGRFARALYQGSTLVLLISGANSFSGANSRLRGNIYDARQQWTPAHQNLQIVTAWYQTLRQ
jgi:hypothetical protein